MFAHLSEDAHRLLNATIDAPTPDIAAQPPPCAFLPPHAPGPTAAVHFAHAMPHSETVRHNDRDGAAAVGQAAAHARRRAFASAATQVSASTLPLRHGAASHENEAYIRS